VLTLTNFYTFKKEKKYSSPTENIDVRKIKTIKSDEGGKDSNVFVSYLIR
jgi:hypothetical protein